ncbi:MAG: helix-turn-helix domain-containing protein [Pseudomonadota bacterium]
MDTIFKALADPARRILLDSLRAKDGQTLQDLQAHLDMTRFGVMKHLGVLEDAGLIVTRKSGRFKHHYLNALPLQEAIDRWIDPYRVKPAARAVLDLKSKLEGSLTMTETPDFMMQTYIRCTQDALWDALTDPAAHAAYNFMASNVERDGDRLVYYTADGSTMLVCRETQLDPKSRIASTFEPMWAPDVPASRVVYLLAAQGDFCQLTVEHYDLPPENAGVQDGWHRTMAGLKSWLETGTPTKFPPTQQ